MVSTSRHIPFSGTPNFRDMGGYSSRDGRRIRHGRFYRSGELSNLTDADLEQFAQLGIETVCDFRRVEENDRDPSRFPADNAPTLVSVAIDPGSTSSFFDNISDVNQGRANLDMAEFMVVINRAFALDFQSQYKRMLDAIENLNEGALLFHCAAGKDRTGFAAALIKMILDVPRDQIMADYLLTAEYFFPDRQVQRLAKKYADSEFGHLDAQMLKPMLEVRPEYLQSAFDAIDENYPSTDDYLHDLFAIDAAGRAEWQARFLE